MTATARTPSVDPQCLRQRYAIIAEGLGSRFLADWQIHQSGGAIPRCAFHRCSSNANSLCAGIRAPEFGSITGIVRPFKRIICIHISEIAVDTVIAVNGFFD